MSRRLQVVTPVFNDWPSFVILLTDLNETVRSLDWEVSILAVDDGSTEDHPSVLPQIDALHEVRIIKLATNIGHQRAIAVGLSFAVEETEADAIVIMDSDGEDRPRDIPRLLDAASGKADFAVVAKRAKRTNTVMFKLFYVLYKAAFVVMTGHDINFGNFSLLSRNYARRLILQSDLWNNLAGALLKSRAPIISLPTDRGHRYAGTSKMNYVSLIVHGMSGLSVYSEVIFVRMLAATGILLLLSSIAIGTVVTMRLATNLTTPGWATTVIFGVLIISSQAVISTLMTLFLLLSSRGQKNVIPARDYRDYILSSTRQMVKASLAITAAQPKFDLSDTGETAGLGYQPF